MALIGDPITEGESLLNTLAGIAGKFIADPAQKTQAEGELRDALQKWDQGQLDVDKQEAASTSLFIAGWRPFVGWVCGVAFAINFIVNPLVLYVGYMTSHPIPPLSLDMTTLLSVLSTMLGFGGLRTFEKLKGVHSSH